MQDPVISVIIPAFNRIDPLKLTLRSVQGAAAGLRTEILLVDDGSTPPLQESLAASGDAPMRILRQPNSGSIVARQTGLNAARGEFVLFLDSDDLVAPDKFSLHVDAMRIAGADVSYSDMAHYSLDGGGKPRFSAGERLEATTDSVDLFLRVQPAPHNPIYRRDYLLRHLVKPLVPSRRAHDPVGDVWLYYNLAPFPAGVVKVNAPLSAGGQHDEDRYSRHWENLGLSALLLAEEFFAVCPRTPQTVAALRVAGECAFNSWRRLPRDFHPRYDARLLALWRNAPRGPVDRLGEPRFQMLARAIGPEPAGRLVRWLRGHRYDNCRTLTDAECRELFSVL